MPSNINNTENKLLRKLRMTVFVDKSYEQIFTIRFTPMTLGVVLAAFAFAIIAGVTVLIAFTSLKEYIPGYPTGEERSLIVQNLQKSDSLLNEIAMRDNMFSNLRHVLRGDIPDEFIKRDSTGALSKQSLASLNSAKSGTETDFLATIENLDKYDVSEDERPANINTGLEETFFFTPIKGIVTERYGEREGHLGTDIVAANGTPVMSTLDGTVFFTEWTVQTGFVIMVQHDNQMVSIYKHCERLLKKAGNRVQGGEAVAIIGNSGELTSGPHLHFELWYGGLPLNPEDYIRFEPEKATE